MAKRSGTASLPLHTGRVPPWLAGRMAALGADVVETIILFEGREGFLKRLSDPFWFQAFGAVLGMDWHSSGITTSVMGALKRGLAVRSRELGVHVCGGRGRQSRKTPTELLGIAERQGLNGDELVRTSRLVAKVDNTALQDGFNLYLHSFVVTDDGDWVVVQQGMNGNAKEARRYHWRSRAVTSFVEEPHDAVVGPNQGVIVNLTDARSKGARDASVELAQSGPATVERELKAVLRDRHLTMPRHHEVRPTDVFLRRLHAAIALANERGVNGFEELLLTPGLGPRTMQALALVSEVAFGAPSRFDDPARFAFAHGGKDGHPHPVPLVVYDKTISSLRHALDRAKVGEHEKIQAFKRLDLHTRQLERYTSGPPLDEIIDEEWKKSPSRGGMTVLGPAGRALEERIQGSKKRPESRQLKLFA
jgi:hypothetical protein